MLKDFLSDEKFCELTRGYVQGTIELLLEKNCEFGIVTKPQNVEFDPPLPSEIMKGFSAPVILFELANYTLQSAHVQEGKLIFEAGFGAEDFASTLSVECAAILQILIESKPVLANFSLQNSEKQKRERSQSIFKKKD